MQQQPIRLRPALPESNTGGPRELPHMKGASMDTGTRIHSQTGMTEGGTAYGMYAETYDPDTYWDVKKGPGPRVMAASTLEDDNVVNMAGEKLGEITEIMIDVPTGRVAYAVLSVGGFLGIGDKLLAVPWRALQIDPSNHRFVLNVSKERIKEAPGFDKDNWPSMADERWATDLHDYYSAPYYWR
jgi:sporulation protein YlmC with PRC-barrel domain